MSLYAAAIRYPRWWLNAFALCMLLCTLLPLPYHNRSAHAQIDSLGYGTPTIQRIRNRGNVLIVGVAYDYAPFGSLDSNGNVTGFEPDLARALADVWGIRVTFVPVAPTARLQSLLAGQVDLIAAALSHTPVNEAVVDFSTHYFTDTNALLLNVDSQGLDFSALSGRTVAAVQDEHALAQLDRYLDATGASVTLLPFQEHAQALRALTAGQADALLGSYTYLANVAAAQSDLSVIMPLAGEQAFGFGIAPGDSFFRNMVDATLQQLYTAGVYTELYTKWFPGRPLPALPLLPGQWPYTIADLPTMVGSADQTLLNQLRARGTLRAGVRYDMPPFGFLDDDEIIQGFEVDLVREFARYWFGDPDAVALVRVTPDTAIPLLNAGQVDLLASALVDNWPNEAEIDFSLPYYADGLGLLVREEGALTTLADLNAKLLATVDGVSVRTQIADLFDTSAPPVFMPFQEYRMAEQALLAGQIDGLIGSTTLLAQTAAGNEALRLLPDLIMPQSYSIGVPTFDDSLRDLVNLTLQVMKLDGTYDAIYAKWFTAPPFNVVVWPGMTTDIPLVLVEEAPVRSAILQPTALPALDVALTSVASTPEPAAAGTAISSTVVVSPTAIPTLITTPRVSVILVPTSTPGSVAATSTKLLPATATSVPVSPPTLTTITTVVNAVVPSIAPVQVRLPATVTVLSNVNIATRTRPATDAPILSLVNGGTSWLALALSDDGEWVQIALLRGLSGWISRDFLVEADLIVGSPTASPSSTPTPAAPSATPTARPTTVPTAGPTLTAQANGATPTPRLLFATATTHRITATDSLASIAQQYYGEQRLWTVIYEANRALIGDDPNVIPVGAELVIPAQP